MRQLLHDHPELPLLVFVALACVVWPAVRRVVGLILLAACLALLVTITVALLGMR